MCFLPLHGEKQEKNGIYPVVIQKHSLAINFQFSLEPLVD
jgi:hypothetical protein